MAEQNYIALLRGINVGRAKRVAMADLRKLIADLGFANVRSLLNSGNVVFAGGQQAPGEIATSIEEALVLKLGVASKVTVLPQAQMRAIVEQNPLLEVASDPSRLLVFVTADMRALRLVSPLAGEDWAPEALALGQHAAYVWCPAGVLASRVVAALGKLLGDGTTSRNWSTIKKLHELAIALPDTLE
jgi:uncharacterized protein (DUF1697 family)